MQVTELYHWFWIRYLESGDLARSDNFGESWDYIQFTKALQRWTGREIQWRTVWRRKTLSKSVAKEIFQTQQMKCDNLYTAEATTQTQQMKHEETSKSQSCVYCDRPDYRSIHCELVTAPDQHNAIWSKKKLYFNCTGSTHRKADCRSTRTCRNCRKRYHSSICGDTSATTKPALTAHREEDLEVIYPTVLVEINEQKSSCLLDTVAGSSYAFAKLIEALNQKQ